MSQSDTNNKIAYDGNGSTVTFSFPYPVAETTDVQVIVITESTGAESVRAIGTGSTEFAITVAANKGSASVTFVTAPLSTEAVLLNRVTPNTQATAYSLHPSLEPDLDKKTQADLTIQEQIDRCVKVPLADSIVFGDVGEDSRIVIDPELPTVIGATAGDVLTLAAGKTSLEYTTANASNATHTGQVTGSGALTVDVTAISDQTLVTAATGDMVLIEDATDGALKRADISTFLDGVGDVTLAGTQTLTNKTLTSPRVGTALLDTSGNEWISVFAPATAVNNIEVVNAVSTGNPEIRAVGDDAVVDLDIKPKSTGRVNISQPTLSDAILGTPTSGTLTNADGYAGDSSLVTTGALNSGSITSGFGNIDTGSSTITTTGKVTAPLVQSGGVTLATTATKAPALGDEGGYFVLSDGSAVAVTIPANASVAFAIGTEIHFEQGGAGAITVGITSDTLNVNANLTKVTNGQYSVCTIKKTSATTWTIFGNLVAA